MTPDRKELLLSTEFFSNSTFVVATITHLGYSTRAQVLLGESPLGKRNMKMKLNYSLILPAAALLVVCLASSPMTHAVTLPAPEPPVSVLAVTLPAPEPPVTLPAPEPPISALAVTLPAPEPPVTLPAPEPPISALAVTLPAPEPPVTLPAPEPPVSTLAVTLPAPEPPVTLPAPEPPVNAAHLA
jgi:hypothetical protein